MEDHPRSRGVYVRDRAKRFGLGGSSPLARGLPRRPRRTGRRPGIIPARAGFTGSTGHPSMCPRDHPRSRGVYWHPMSPKNLRVGSSPLARGLPLDDLVLVLAIRIIPARAGFTLEVGLNRVCRGDHPRSRGVYPADPRGRWAPLGSSPLARGLRRRTARGRRMRRDHPRSRGVYAPRWQHASLVTGSSPLARGLRPPSGSPAPPARIIPARAGFTQSRLPPRFGASGSSPLARGLRDRPVVTGHEGGIIPARAGFTITIMSPGLHMADHPRSRGVYPPRP